MLINFSTLVNFKSSLIELNNIYSDCHYCPKHTQFKNVILTYLYPMNYQMRILWNIINKTIYEMTFIWGFLNLFIEEYTINNIIIKIKISYKK